MSQSSCQTGQMNAIYSPRLKTLFNGLEKVPQSPKATLMLLGEYNKYDLSDNMDHCDNL